MPRQLKNLVIEEVSGVDRGAGEGVKIMLMKRVAGADDVIDFDAIRAAVKKKHEPVIAAALAKLQATIATIKSNDKISDADAEAEAAAAVKLFKNEIGLEPSTEIDMTPEQLAKAIADGVTAQLAKSMPDYQKNMDRLALLEATTIIGKLSATAQEYAKAMSDEDKKKFAGKKPEDCEKEADDAKKALLAKNAIDPTIAKRLEDGETALKKVAVLEAAQELVTFGKRALALGLPESHGEVLMKVYQGDPAAIKKHEEALKGLVEQVKTGKIFNEFGDKSQQGGASAYDQLLAKAEELRKVETKLTSAQAFEKVFTDPANLALVEQHNASEMKKRMGAAA